MRHKLPRSFYCRPTLQVARELLGMHLVRKLGSRELVGMIVEVEAYLGKRDPASHAFRGRTKRNDVMFWRGGHLYVYFTYGMHFCANVVTRNEGIGEAVLIRAVEPMKGIVTMRRNRGLPAQERNLRLLTSGPARFCEAFGIQREDNGTDLLGKKIYLVQKRRIPGSRVEASNRIGIKVGTKKRWRFFIRNNRFVSR
ncbi:MAG: DNA-3-methyladenine glycosylase [Ignavibacteriales bacterium]|nr:DNA-3-methyladenine glycosylase [Ignavibacteriales bacterium]